MAKARRPQKIQRYSVSKNSFVISLFTETCVPYISGSNTIGFIYFGVFRTGYVQKKPAWNIRFESQDSALHFKSHWINSPSCCIKHEEESEERSTAECGVHFRDLTWLVSSDLFHFFGKCNTFIEIPCVTSHSPYNVHIDRHRFVNFSSQIYSA